MASATALQEVQSFYLAYYGRPADPSGLTYWADRVDAEGLSSLVNAFGTSAEATELLANKTTAEKVNAVYQQLFGRDAESGPTGLDFYVSQIESGAITLQTLARDVFGGATGDDATVIANKVQVADVFTAELAADAELAAEYVGIAATTGAKAIISSIDATAASVTAATAQVNVVLAVTTSTLTTGVDTIAGTAGRDKISGSNSGLAAENTLNATDVIDGGEGSDQLILSVPTAWTGFTTGSVKGVETLDITNPGASSLNFNMTGISGVDTVRLTNEQTNGVVTLTAMPTAVKALYLEGIKGGTGDTAFTTAYLAAAAEVSGTSNALSVTFDGLGTKARSGSTAPNQALLTIADIEQINLALVGTNIASFAGTDLTKITASGSGTLAMNDVPTSLTSFDGSAMTGAFVGTFEDITGATLATVKTGSASDTVTITQAGTKTAATIDLGTGTDTLILNSAGGVAAYTIKGAETLALNNITTATTVSGTNLDDTLSKVTVSATDVGGASLNANGVAAAVVLQDMGARTVDLTLNGAISANGDITVDNKSGASASWAAASTNAKLSEATDTAAGDVKFSAATGAVTFNVGSAVTLTGAVEASKATAVTLNVTSALNSAGSTQYSQWNSTLTVPEATSVTINSGAHLGTLATLAAAKATSANITASGNGELVMTAALLTDLTITSGSGKDDAGSTSTTFRLDDNVATGFSKLQSLTATVNSGTLELVDNTGDTGLTGLPSINTLTLTGAGTSTSTGQSAFKIYGDLGSSTANSYGMNIKISGMKGGVSIDDAVADLGAGESAGGDILVGAGFDVTMDLTGATGEVDFGDIATSSVAARNVTVSANGGETNGAIYAGAIYASGDVTFNAAGRTGIVKVGTIVGDNVTVNVKGSGSGSEFGAITAKTSATLTLNEGGNGGTSAATVTSSSASTALAVNLTGSALADTITITGAGSAQASITVSGTLDGSDKLIVTAGTSTAAQTISLSGISGYADARISGQNSASKGDSIVGGDGLDFIDGGAGQDTMTGGAGADVFTFATGDSTMLLFDTITDFSVGDKIVFQDATLDVLNTTAVTGGTDTVGLTVYGTVDFSTITSASSYDTLAEKVGLINVALNVAGEAVFFSHDSATWMFIDTDTAANNVTTTGLVIKLTGVPMPSADTSFTEAAALGAYNAATGVSGFGA